MAFDFLKPKGKESIPPAHAAPKEEKRAFGVNLMTTEVVKEATQRLIFKNLIQLLVSFLIAVGIAALAYGVLLFWGAEEQKKADVVHLQLDATNSDIAKLEKNNAALLAFQAKLTTIKSLFDQRTSVAPFFQKLQQTTLPNVFYQTLTYGDDGSVALSASTTDYTTIGRQLLAFQQSQGFISSVDIKGITSSLDQVGNLIGVNFTVNLMLDPNVLKPTVPDQSGQSTGQQGSAVTNQTEQTPTQQSNTVTQPSLNTAPVQQGGVLQGLQSPSPLSGQSTPFVQGQQTGTQQNQAAPVSAQSSQQNQQAPVIQTTPLAPAPSPQTQAPQAGNTKQ